MVSIAEKVLRNLRTQAFIDGEFCEASGSARIETVNPATGQALAAISSCGTADVDRAVKSARRAFRDGRWSKKAPEERKKVLLRFADLIEEHADEIAVLDALDAGKPITDCRTIDVPEVVKTFRWYAEAADKVFGAVAPTGPAHLGLIVREPVGVVAAVLPWNFPALMYAWKVGPALASGNSVVVKPSELTSLSGLRLAELAAQAGVPGGVLNVVPGTGEAAGQALGRHPDVDMVSMTGSTEVGRLFLNYSAASNLKKVVLELGGKNPQVVLADPPRPRPGCPRGLVGWVLEHGRELLRRVTPAGARLGARRAGGADGAARQAWTVGDPLDPATRIGPLVEEQHMEKVIGLIRSGRDEGAALVLGGERALEETGGYYIAPTILDHVRGDMRVAREESLAPLSPCSPSIAKTRP